MRRSKRNAGEYSGKKHRRLIDDGKEVDDEDDEMLCR
jgi:hypothetical protein